MTRRHAHGLRTLAVLVSLALHALVIALTARHLGRSPAATPPAPVATIIAFKLPPPEASPATRVDAAPPPSPRSAPRAPRPASLSQPPPAPRAEPSALATQAAPPPPTAAEWAFAARYTLKNSKGYRYSWGQQVRSMMGTAVEGPDQGFVRFRVEIAPDGRLARLETLWTTSDVAEQRARAAIERMPPLPPTPTGQPLVFERTITFTPFGSDGPPIYRDDCLPDPPAFRNPFVWDGQGPLPRPATAPSPPAAPPDRTALEECLKQLPQDSVEAEAAQDRRLRDQWDSSTLGR